MRPIRHRYRDPLDQIWSATAARVGLRLERSGDVYASTDGQGTLRLGTPETLDADDCLTQMIFHELCHSLIEGHDAFERPDWGLDNTSRRDDIREWGCLRLQAALSAEYGLRKVLAPTTDFRSFYDALPIDPLCDRQDRSVALAILGLQRVDRAPWAPHVRNALAATAQVAHATASFVSKPASDDAQPSLWTEVTVPLERHPVGFALSPVSRSSMDNGQSHTCGNCAWMYLGGRGRAVSRCRQADGARVQLTWTACDRYEGALDCQTCGACCREAYHSVTVSRRDPALVRVSDLVVDRGGYLELRRVATPEGSRCAALLGGWSDSDEWHRYSCSMYESRPRPCREFENGGAHCLTARRRVGMSR